MNGFEIERRFWLYPCSMKRFLRENAIAYDACPIIQFYLVAETGRVERYRQKCTHYIRTIKKGQGLVREEQEEEIGREAFEEALKRNRGGIIRKVRRRFVLEGRTYELDSFKGPLKGLNILEIEFDNEEEAKGLRLPAPLSDLVIAEVTNEPAFSNGALSRTMRIPALASPLPTLLDSVRQREDFLKASTPLALKPSESSANALKALFTTLLMSVKANRQAMLAGDGDPERLHQFRVAMRKLRALLSQMSPLFDEAWRREHKQKLAALMRQTGTKRDIDVYLMQMDYYKTLVDTKYHAGLDALRRWLEVREEEERKALTDFLQDDALLNELNALTSFATTHERTGLSERAENPVIVEVKKALKKRYANVLKRGAAVGRHSPAHTYHEVRIEVKKLRYLMEFFASILEEEAYGVMLKRLKTIQTILGEHQDLDVQRAHLKTFTELPELHDKETKKAIDALRSAMGKLEEKKRAEFRDHFSRFAKTADLFHRMVCRF
ncbi:CHAD domain-containing protein [Hydrogenimonas sp. SS33]|uniref:CHAD domain-containing protein n=1 Tax=Hydrogenimonas leucolamina TaxID=2954236 RepID=UPI00336BC6FA